MPRHSLAGAALLSLVLTMPAHAQNRDLKRSAIPLEAAKVLKPGDVLGRLGIVNGSTFILRLEFERLELKPGARNQRNPSRQYQNLLGEYNRLSQAQRQLLTARTAQQQINALRQIQQTTIQIQRSIWQQLGYGGLTASPYVIKKDYRDIEIEMAPKMVVRINFLPFVYDDKDNLRKYTKEEIKALKGPNPSLPGYKSELSALKRGQTVRVTLVRIKENTKVVDEKKDDKGKKDPEKKDADKKVPEKKEPEKVPEKVLENKSPEPEKVPEKAPDSKTTESKLVATRILILEESDVEEKPDRAAKKK